MERLQFIQNWVDQLLLVALTIILLVFCQVKVQAQGAYDVRLHKQPETTDTSVACFNIQISSANEESWELAGQNYRLFYDASIATFKSGQSLLGEKYQAFKLVQDIQDIDASEVNGNLVFEKNIGFLNFGIDLIDPTEMGEIVPEKEKWLSTAKICFEGIDLNNKLEKFDIVWARNGMTDAYATSFVEISARTTNNQLFPMSGNEYYDFPLNEIESENDSEQDLNEHIKVKAKVFLQGAFDLNDKLMKDDLRKLKYIPSINPYGIKDKSNAPEQVLNQSIFNTSGEDAIVDWVLLELRQKDNAKIVVATRSALLQRDGDIVDIDDAKSPVVFSVPQDAYFIVVKHRNHLGAMTDAAIDLKDQLIEVDFTHPETPVFGEFARKINENIAMLWGGDADGNNYLIFQGGGVGLPDNDKVFFDVFSDSRNHQNRYNFISEGYKDSDLNMDGQIKYQGGDNDIDNLIFFNVFFHPININYHSNFIVQEQIPKSN